MKNFVFAAIVILVLGSMFLIFRPETSELNNNNSANTTPPPQSQPNVKTFSFVIENSKMVGESTIRVNEGDQVVFKLKSDKEEEFHLHGYDRAVDLTPDAEVQLSFVANLTGRFEFELEKSKTHLGALEVLPK